MRNKPAVTLFKRVLCWILTFLLLTSASLFEASKAKAAVSVNWNGTSYSIPEAGETNWSTLTDFLVALGSYAQTTSKQVSGVRVATSSPVTLTTADYTVVTNLSVAGAVAVTLPTGVLGQVFVIADGRGDAATNNVTISGSGGQGINGSASYVINENNGGAILQFNGTSWTILSDFVGNSPRFTSLVLSGNASVGGSLTVTGLGIFSSTLAAAGATTLASTLEVFGASTLAALSATSGTFSSTLGVTGASTLASVSGTTGTFSSTFNATGASTFGSTVAVTGALTQGGVTVPTISSTSTLTNKMFLDSTTLFADNADSAKRVVFEVSGISTGTTKTWTFPDQSDDFVGRTVVQTLTNKTLTAPVISGGSISGGTGSFTTLSTSGTNVLTSTLDVDGAVDFDSTLNVLDTATFQSSIIASSAVQVAGALTQGGVVVPTISSTSTLSNKTLASPIVSGQIKHGVTTVSTSTINNMALPSGSVVRFDGATPALSGIAGGTDGMMLYFVRTASADTMTILDQSASSSVGNRIITGTAGTITVTNEGAFTLVYDGITSAWRLLSVQQ